jgi:hypothetical protein
VWASAEAAEAGDDRPPARPKDLSPGQLRFTRQPATRWFNPNVLIGSALRVGLTEVFGSFLDKRELQANIPAQADLDYTGRRDVWIDYVADTGDGFDATYSVASLLARRSLAVEPGEHGGEGGGDGGDGGSGPLHLPRGDVLVLGGDEVYPTATAANYENRLVGPFRAALPWTVDDHPQLFALPGNHDWFDGLTGFLRLFGQQRWVGGWQTKQRRSYFALKLPYRWWLWGMDIQAGQYVDDPQLRFFQSVIERHARPGDRLVLATCTPTWITQRTSTMANRNLAYVERTLLQRYGIELVANLAGDLHHYSRYSRQTDPATATGPPVVGTPHKITSGGGGAFLHPTHDLPREIELTVDPEARAHGDGRSTDRYELVTRYPDAKTSFGLAFQSLLLPWRHRWFIAVGAVFNVMLLWTNQFGIRSLGRGAPASFEASAQRSGWDDLVLGLVRNPPSALTLIVLAVGLIGLAEAPATFHHRRATKWAWRVVLGLIHLSAQIATVLGVALLSVELAERIAPDTGFAFSTSLIDAFLGGVASAFVLGAYFALANTLPGLRVHGNETFSAARIDSYKNFLRMHIDEDGLTIYALGLDRVATSWKPHPDGEGAHPEAPWLVAREGAPKVGLIDHVHVPTD